MITLTSGTATLRVDPATGGSVVAYRLGAIDLLRPTPEGSRNVKEHAAFPLFPFSGRIDRGVFDFRGRTVTLAENLPGEPYPIHGQAFQLPWQVSAQSSHTLSLAVDYPGKDWPWAYRAEQTFALHPSCLTLSLGLQN